MTGPSSSPSAAERNSDRGVATRPGGYAGFLPTELRIDDRRDRRLTRAKLRDGDPPDRRIRNIAPLDTATASDISFLDNAKYLGELATRVPAPVWSRRASQASAPRGLAVLVTPHPYPRLCRGGAGAVSGGAASVVAFRRERTRLPRHVHRSARLEAGVDHRSAGGYRAARAKSGPARVIAAGAVIGPDVCIGRDCAIGAGVTILHALIGDRVIIHPGVRIGQDGFGYLPSPQGHQKIPQTRRVIIQDDVEIGANTTIDRGATRDTVIGEGTKIDNLVQIGHNCLDRPALLDRLSRPAYLAA